MQEGALLEVAGGVKQGRQGHVGPGPLHLDLVHQVRHGVVLQDGGGDAGEEFQGIDEGLAHGAHFPGGQGQALLMEVFKLRQELRVRRDGGAVDELTLGLVHGPAVPVGLQGQGDLADEFAVGAGLQDGDAADGLVHLGVGVADEQGVHPVPVGLGHFPHAGAAVLAVQAVVDGADDHVGLALQFVQDFADLLHGRRVGPLPLGDVGRVHAEHRHLHAVHVKDVIGVQPALPVGLVEVAAQGDALELPDLLLGVLEVEIELVVAQGPGVILQVVQGVDHGIGLLVQEGLDVVGLGGVAGVQQKQVRVLLPLRLDDGGGVGHAGFIFLVGGIVEGVDHAVQIAGLQDGDGFPALLRRQGGDGQPGQHRQNQRQRQERFACGSSHKMTSLFSFSFSGTPGTLLYDAFRQDAIEYRKYFPLFLSDCDKDSGIPRRAGALPPPQGERMNRAARSFC